MYAEKQRNKDRQEIYAFSHVECWLEEYAKSTDQPAKELCSRVGALLLAQGQGAGYTMPEPGVPGHSTKVGRPLVQMEVAEHPSGNLHGGKQAKKRAAKWTAARRLEYSKRMKKMQGRLQAARLAKAA